MCMSTINTCKKPRGRPRVDSEQVSIRIDRPLLAQIDEFAGTYGMGRPEAVRKLVTMAFGLKSVVEGIVTELELSGTSDSLAAAKEIRDILAP